MSYGGGGFGGEADTGGVAGGSSSSSGSNGDGGGRAANNGGMSGRGNLGSELGTSGPGQGYGSGHNSTGGNGGGNGGSNGSSGQSASGYSGTFGDSVDTGRVGSSMTGNNAMVSMETEAKTALDSFMDAIDAEPMSMQEATSRAQESIQVNAKPGLLGNAMSVAAGLANPALGVATNVGMRGYNAQQAAQAHNAQFGTSVDTSLGSNIGAQAKGALGGFAGSKAGGQVGSSFGASVAGVPGAVVGGLVGSATMGNIGRDAAMSTGNPGQAPGDPGAGINGGGDSTATAVASAPPSTPPATNPGSGYVPVTDYGYGADRGNPFDQYSNYAAQFFS